MFEQVPTALPDAILGLTEAFRKDPNPHKINLGVGVYKDEQGNTPVMACVKEAQRRLLEAEKNKNYLPIEGSPEYGQRVRELLLGPDHEAITSGRAVTAHTPGGTGALRVVADYLKKLHPATRVWLSEPTWPNHPQLFSAAGLDLRTYPYFDAQTSALAFDAMLDTLGRELRPGDVVLLHACCHNPTGVDPTPQQWDQIAALLHEKQALSLVDFAYQGLGDGLEQDAVGLKRLAQPDRELIVCSSFSKNFGLYNERVGALTIIARQASQAQAVLSQVKTCIRTNYSNPPAHGGAIVTTILADAGLRAQWEGEVQQMRDRIQGMRRLFVQTLQAKGAKRDFSFIERQKGMFSFSGLNKEQVERLRKEEAIYIVGSGRINVAGMTPANMDRLCQAIVKVL
ncbi:MAG TPA: amino acid aminotransferase [Phycisphaeraceae bacterium]